LQRFRSLAQGRTVVVITHRFTTTMRADIIHVMAEVQIIESDSHDELLTLGGSYAGSWKAQMRQQTDGNGFADTAVPTETLVQI
jgi:ATP-binding cassette subfamily B protein